MFINMNKINRKVLNELSHKLLKHCGGFYKDPYTVGNVKM